MAVQQTEAFAPETIKIVSKKTPREDRYVIADALRLTAIIAVVLNHLVAQTNPRFFGYTHMFSFLGTWGVATFFVLSGYLLSRPFVQALIGDKPFPSMRLFLLRRLLRIVPLYVVALFFSVIVVNYFAIMHPTSTDVVSHLFFLHDFDVATIESINGPLWTMPVDFEFYFALPFMALLLSPVMRSAPRANRANILLAIIAFGIVLTFVYRIMMIVRFPQFTHDEFASKVYINNGIGLGNIFLLGTALGMLLDIYKFRLSQSQIATFAAVEIMLFIAVWRTDEGSSSLAMTMHMFLSAVSSALLLIVLPQIPFIINLSKSRLVVSGASLAYAIYLFHLPILEAAFKALALGRNNLSFVILSFAVILLVIPIAYVMHRFVERPFLLLKNRQR